MSDKKQWNVLVTGGAGYVGSALVPMLLAEGHKVTVLDLYLYGDVFKDIAGNPNLTQIKGDLRDAATVAKALQGCTAVIHLACISNDPSYDLDPNLGRSINYDAFRPLVRAAKEVGVKRFVYASSSSVYGIKEGVEVTEDLSLEPLTDYSKFKALCEQELMEERSPGFVTCTIRPATVCGYAPRQRLDVIVNILTNHAFNTGRLKVLGGGQLRPNIHIDDMCQVYLDVLQAEDATIDGRIWNAGYENHSVMQLGEMVRDIVGAETGRTIEVDVQPTNDNRSYHVSSEKIRRELGFTPRRTIEDAVRGLVKALKEGKLPNSMEDPIYFNIKQMQKVTLK